MKIIEKIEIKYFRSFSDKSMIISDLKDLNIFSGKNDTGKSNVLRALNLFFNYETDIGKPFIFDDEFSKHRFEEIQNDKKSKKENNTENKRIRGQEASIEIKIHFNLKELHKNKQYPSLPEQFNIIRSWKKSTEPNKPYQESNIVSQKNKEKGINNASDKGNLKLSETKFLNNFRFEYIPAIKDKNFIHYLFSRTQESILDEDISDLKNKSKDLSNILNNNSELLISNFKKATGIDSGIKTPEKLIDFYKSSEIYTNYGNTQNTIPLLNRGDGIQARFIPSMLQFIAEKYKNRFIIWGFEEPENSYEYSLASELANQFKDEYCKDKQIFITSHSFIFLSLEGNNISKYRVYKEDEKTKIKYIDSNKTDLETLYHDKNVSELLLNDLGIFYINKKIKDYYDELCENKIQLEDMQTQLELFTKPVLLFEGKTDIEHFSLAYKALYDKELKDDFDYWIPDLSNDNKRTYGSGAEKLNYFLFNFASKFINKKIIGIFDYDIEGCNQYNGLRKSTFKNHSIPNNNYDKILKHNNSTIYAMLIKPPDFRNDFINPNDDSQCYLSVELLYEDSLINKSNKKYPTKKEDTVFGFKSKNKEIFYESIKSKYNTNPSDVSFEGFKGTLDIIREIFQIR